MPQPCSIQCRRSERVLGAFVANTRHTAHILQSGDVPIRDERFRIVDEITNHALWHHRTVYFRGEWVDNARANRWRRHRFNGRAHRHSVEPA